MNEQVLASLKYPIGKFNFPDALAPEERDRAIDQLVQFPSQMKEITKDLSMDQLLWNYRPNGWNIAQVVHHCADSHMNAMTRFKWTLTEDHPTVKTYQEADWAKLPDSLQLDIQPSLQLLEGLHQRWTGLLKAFKDEQWQFQFHHPEMKRDIRLDQLLGLYEWHSKHHLAHIRSAIDSEGAFAK